MATRAKYIRAKATDENNEVKLDTDIIMRFSPSYGTVAFTQANMSDVRLLYFSGRPKDSLLSRLQRSLWTRLFGWLRL